MRLTTEDIAAMKARLVAVREEGSKYFAEATPVEAQADTPWPEFEGWQIQDEQTLQQCEALRQAIKKLSVDIAAAARASPLLADADMQELRHNTRQMLANVYFPGIPSQWSVRPPRRRSGLWGSIRRHMRKSRSEMSCRRLGRFDQAAAKTLDLLDLLLPTDGSELAPLGTANYRPNTAFVMMAIDDSKPELEDIRTGIKEVFEEFGIVAITADEIEHEEAITDRILSEIESSEFLVADLTHERPNVYYEIGHAHALNKRVILMRKKGTNLHFDVAHRNCPEYENATDLKRRLRKRLESMTNKKRPSRS